ncbi:MAG: zinc ribbon domain-containing protein, partial [Clostridia bacterium]|nr:zinc ribbon domain-containing protein [Clostridia bacterium]
MVLCTRCGATLAPDTKACPVCGAASPGKELRFAAKSLRKKLFRTRENNRAVDPAEVKTGKYWAAAAYIPLGAPVAYFAKRKNSFVRFHVREGLRLLLAEGIAAAAGLVVGVLLSLVWSRAVFWTELFFLLAGIVFLLFGLLGVRHALMGRQKELPF